MAEHKRSSEVEPQTIRWSERDLLWMTRFEAERPNHAASLGRIQTVEHFGKGYPRRNTVI